MNHTLLEIDFLPADYHQHRAQRRLQLLRLAIAGVCGVLIASAALLQQHRRHALQQQLEGLQKQYAQAERLNAQLADCQARLAAAEARARLWTYLQHPWPRTQLLDALLEPLPEAVAFQTLTISRQSPSPALPEQIHPGASQPPAPAPRRPAAEEDLAQLRQQLDPARTIISITGTATDSHQLYEYLRRLAQNDLFVKTELESIEGESTSQGRRLRFSARIVVRPGHGQPGGPDAAIHNKRRPDQATTAGRHTPEARVRHIAQLSLDRKP